MIGNAGNINRYEVKGDTNPNCGIQNLFNDKYYILRTLLDICGCMDNDIMEIIYTVLRTKYEYDQLNIPCNYEDFAGIDPKSVLLIYHLLDSVDILEHGTSIRGAWIHLRGKMVFPLIQANHDDKITQEIVNFVCNVSNIAWNRVKDREDLTITEYCINDLLLKIVNEE